MYTDKTIHIPTHEARARGAGLVLTAAFVAASVASAAAMDAPDERKIGQAPTAEVDSADSGAQSSSRAGGRSDWGFEVFARGSAGNVHVNETINVAATFDDDPIADSLGGAGSVWDLGGGGGVRLRYRRFAFEAVYERLASEQLIPLVATVGSDVLEELQADSSAFRVDGDRANADLFLGQFIYELPIANAPGSIFFGVGGGVIRIEDPVSEAFRTADFTPDLDADLFSAVVTTDQTGFLFGASAGAAVEFGRFYVRPRVDLFFGQRVTAKYEIRANLEGTVFDDLGDVPEIAFAADSTITPRLLLVSVEIGFRSN